MRQSLRTRGSMILAIAVVAAVASILACPGSAEARNHPHPHTPPPPPLPPPPPPPEISTPPPIVTPPPPDNPPPDNPPPGNPPPDNPPPGHSAGRHAEPAGAGDAGDRADRLGAGRLVRRDAAQAVAFAREPRDEHSRLTAGSRRLSRHGRGVPVCLRKGKGGPTHTRRR